MSINTQANIGIILSELERVLDSISNQETSLVVEILLSKKSKGGKVVGVGAGRVGAQVRAFCMRLGHLGFNSWFLGDSTVPSINSGDILLVASGSGETKTIVELVKIAKKNGCTIVCITGDVNSTIGVMADYLIEMKAPSKTKSVEGFNSWQPMTTLNEQCLGILFDALVLDIMKITGETHESMWGRHSNLE